MPMSGGRALALLAVGLFTGAIGAFVVMSTIQQRHTVPRGVMALMQYHMSQARKTAASNSCDAPAALHHVERMRALAEDATPIFAAIGYADATFERRRMAFLTEVDKGIAAGANCAGISTALKPIADACAACHHETR